MPHPIVSTYFLDHFSKISSISDQIMFQYGQETEAKATIPPRKRIQHKLYIVCPDITEDDKEILLAYLRFLELEFAKNYREDGENFLHIAFMDDLDHKINDYMTFIKF